MSLSAKGRRAKGHAFEREIARLLREIFGATSRNIQSRDGSEIADIDNPAFVVECKHQRRPSIVAALEQAEKAARPGLRTVAVCKFHGSRRDPIVAMRLGEWLDLVREWKERGEC